MTRFLVVAALALLAAPAWAQDTSLHDYLTDDQPWKEAASGYTFTDALCVDAPGNLYFSDVKAGKGIYMIAADTGKVSLFLDNLPGISGLQIGPDGRFYACNYKEQRILAISRDGKVEEMLAGVKCNDLVVTKKGYIYFTETPTQRIHLVKADKTHLVVDEGHVSKPNGITISPDEGTLVVSDSGSKNVWSWHIEPDGRLTGAGPYMTMWLPLGKDTASGDGATTESKGRYFITSDLGVQVFDTAGRLSGIIAKPEPNGKVVSAEFAGKDHDILYVGAGGKIYGRKLKVTGYFR